MLQEGAAAHQVDGAALGHHLVADALVGAGRVLLGLSGGVDSSVVAALLHKAIGDQLTCVFVDNGLLRHHEGDQVMQVFARNLGVRVIRVADRKVVLANRAFCLLRADRAEAVLKGFSRSVYYCGDYGNGSKLKYVANLLVTIHNLSTAEAMVLGELMGPGRR